MASATLTHLESHVRPMERIVEGDRPLHLPWPDDIPEVALVGCERILKQARAAWFPADGGPPQSFRLCGPPGVGKNSIVYHLARHLGRDLYMLVGNEELKPEDIACTPVFTSTDRIEYVASPLYAAMRRGGIFFFDEIGKAPSGALSPLVSVLDDRRTLTSVQAGLTIRAHPDFLFCAALNEDEEAGGRLPDPIAERLSIVISVGIPSIETLRKILDTTLPAVDRRWIDIYLRDFWKDGVSPRAARDHVRHAHSIAGQDAKETGRSPKTEGAIRSYLEMAGSGSNGPTQPSEDAAKTHSTPNDSAPAKERSDNGEPFLVLSRRQRKQTIH